MYELFSSILDHKTSKLIDHMQGHVRCMEHAEQNQAGHHEQKLASQSYFNPTHIGMTSTMQIHQPNWTQINQMDKHQNIPRFKNVQRDNHLLGRLKSVEAVWCSPT